MRRGLGCWGWARSVYELIPPWLFVRIARATDYLRDAESEVAVARWLESAGFPAVRLAGPADQPVVAGGRVVTFWAMVSEGQVYGTVADLGWLLRRLHDLEPPPSLGLPELRPFAGAEERISRAGLGGDDREFLVDRLARLRGSYGRLRFVLPRGPVHGDANAGSVLRSRWDSAAVLTDLGGFAAGPREWDLVLTALYFERLGWHTAKEYRAFVAGYGFDVRTWPGYRVLRDIRELIMITWLAQDSGHVPEIAAEVSGRIADLRCRYGTVR
jgi:Phosphotransferase enzyme family